MNHEKDSICIHNARPHLVERAEQSKNGRLGSLLIVQIWRMNIGESGIVQTGRYAKREGTMNRKEAIKAALGTAATASVLRGVAALSQQTNSVAISTTGSMIYVNPAIGSDTSSGAKGSPLRALAEAARRVNASTSSGAITILLSGGIYALGETVTFKPTNRSFSKSERLTIRAEVLPDDPEWHTGRMPTIIHTMALPEGGASSGIATETSHVTVQGLRILGVPVVETPKPGFLQRAYPIMRSGRDLDDLEVAQCLFAGDVVTNPNHVCIIASGSGAVVHHCIFYGAKISVVFWLGEGTGHAMKNCVCHGIYGSSVWTAAIPNDFDYRNNVVSNSNYVWTYQSLASATADTKGKSGREFGPSPDPSKNTHYKVINSYMGGNRKLTGTGTGERLEYADYDSSFLDLIGTKITDQPVVLERDQTKRNYLHPVAGSEAAKVGAGLFMKPTA